MTDSSVVLQILLANGQTWGIRASGPRGGSVLQGLRRTARLGALAGTPHGMVWIREHPGQDRCEPGNASAIYDLWDGAGASAAFDMARTCTVLAAQIPEALLLHGALVAKGGRGVLLAGPGSRGKTTTAKRLPAPWQILSDDATLVVPHPAGGYAAHPWPTWSRLMLGQSDETWDVQQWVPLEHVFFLSWAEPDTAEPVRGAKALCLVLESIEQLRTYLPVALVSAEQRLRGLEAASQLVKSIPISILHVSLSGPVWLAIERALELHEARP